MWKTCNGTASAVMTNQCARTIANDYPIIGRSIEHIVTDAPAMAGLEVCGWHIVLDGDGDDVAAQRCRRRRRRLGADMARRVFTGRRVCHRADICDRKQEGEKKCVRGLLRLVPSRGGDGTGGRRKRRTKQVRRREGQVAKRTEAAIFTRA